MAKAAAQKNMRALLATSSSKELVAMLAESFVTHALLVQRMAIAEEDAKHAGELLVKAAQVIQEFGIGQNPETGETAIEFAERWYTAEQWAKGFGPREVAMTKKPEGSVGPGATTTEATVEPEDDRPKYLKDTTLGLGKDELEMPFVFHVGPDGLIRCMPVAENAEGLSYTIHIDEARLEWPKLRGLEPGKGTPQRVDPTDPEGEIMVDLIKAAKWMELDRLQRLGILDDDLKELFPLERAAEAKREGGPEELNVAAGESLWLGGTTFVKVIGRAMFYDETGAQWSEGNNDFPAGFVGGTEDKYDTFPASAIHFDSVTPAKK